MSVTISLLTYYHIARKALSWMVQCHLNDIPVPFVRGNGTLPAELVLHHSAVGQFRPGAHVRKNPEGRKGGPSCESARLAFYLCISQVIFLFLLPDSLSKWIRKKAKWQWQRLKKNIIKKRDLEEDSHSVQASAVPQEGQPCTKQLIFLLLFQRLFQAKMQCLQANSLITPNSSNAASSAAKGEPGPTSGFGRQRGKRAEQLITDSPERKYMNINTQGE